jgi:hypothetical protein
MGTAITFTFAMLLIYSWTDFTSITSDFIKRAPVLSDESELLTRNLVVLPSDILENVFLLPNTKVWIHRSCFDIFARNYWEKTKPSGILLPNLNVLFGDPGWGYAHTLTSATSSSFFQCLRDSVQTQLALIDKISNTSRYHHLSDYAYIHTAMAHPEMLTQDLGMTLSQYLNTTNNGLHIHLGREWLSTMNYIPIFNEQYEKMQAVINLGTRYWSCSNLHYLYQIGVPNHSVIPGYFIIRKTKELILTHSCQLLGEIVSPNIFYVSPPTLIVYFINWTIDMLTHTHVISPDTSHKTKEEFRNLLVNYVTGAGNGIRINESIQKPQRAIPEIRYDLSISYYTTKVHQSAVGAYIMCFWWHFVIILTITTLSASGIYNWFWTIVICFWWWWTYLKFI